MSDARAGQLDYRDRNDHLDDSGFRLPIGARRALDAFSHPHAYAPSPGHDGNCVVQTGSAE
jgi:hypothetical protein